MTEAPEVPSLPTNGRSLERVVVWVGRAGAVAALVWAGSSRFTALERQGETVLDELSKRPTAEGVENQVLKAVQPLTQGMTEVRVELRSLAERVTDGRVDLMSLAERVQRLENDNK